MLQIQQIRADKESIIDRILKIRKLDVSSQVNEIFDLDVRKRETQKSLDDFLSYSFPRKNRKDDDDAVLQKHQKWLWSWFWRGGNASQIVGKKNHGPAY